MRRPSEVFRNTERHSIRPRAACRLAWRVAAGTLFLLQSLACKPAHDGRSVTIAGSTSVQPYVEKWAERFAQSAPDLASLRFDVQAGGSSAGVRAVRDGAAVLGMSSRALTQEEQAGVSAIVVARDALAVIVHRTNPLRGLDRTQLRAVFVGQLRYWTDLGVTGGAITVISREEGSGTRSAFEELGLGGAAVTPRALIQDAAGAIRDLVAGDPAAIGFISVGLLDERVRALAIDGIWPTAESVNEGGYPLVRPFLFVLHGPVSAAPPYVRSFIEFVLSPPGQALARQEGLLPAER